ncbi:MAG TPA: hypothetical protein DET40_23295 [Lentisphaeria bacterium]|nr:MAG: hypothetical protein A2X45_24630 [Lentisphaerae bacterium GWF2_50_93]HCE46481.1 hypothetical protein [Lentisphaeria bacterium]
MKKTILSCFAVALLFLYGCNESSQRPEAANAAVEPKPDNTPVVTSEEDMLVVSTAVSPRVAYAVSLRKNILNVAVAVEPFDASAGAQAVGLKVGLAADKALILTEKDAVFRKLGTSNLYEFKVPAEKLVASAEGWDKFRMGMSVDWPVGPFGQPRQRETFLQNEPTRAAHAELSLSSAFWQLVNLDEFAKTIADRKLQIAFDFKQPVDGKASIVIEDEKGGRVRNLISGQPMAKGSQRIVWDATNDKGDLMPPGKYQWRSISHPGIRPEYVMSFCDGSGSNHGTLHSAATGGKYLFFGTSVSEGGYELIQLEQDGKFVRGYNSPMGHGLAKVAVAADDKFLYAAYDGTGWTQKVDRNKPDWKAENKITLVKIDFNSGNVVDYSKERFAVISSYWIGPGSPEKMPGSRTALSGMAFLNGKLYIGDSVKNAVLEVDPEKGTVLRSIALANPAALAAGKGKLYALSEKKLLELDLAAGKAGKIISDKLEGNSAGLAVGPDGKFYVSDSKSHVVRMFDAAGKSAGVIGKPGGITYGSAEIRTKMGGYGEEGEEAMVTPGPYDPLRLHNPMGLVMSADGHLWVTENSRWKPKRLAAYDTVKGTMWKEFFGPTAYGAPGCGFDPEDSTRWFGQDTLFKIDLKAKTSTPVSTLGGEEGMHYRFWKQDGRTFVIAYGKITYIEELLPNNTLKLLAFLSSGHQYAYAHSWNPPKEFVEAFKRDYPNVKYEYGKTGQPNHGYGMIWVDRNGDGKMEKEEIEFSTAAESLAGSGWGHDFNDLTIRVPAKVAGKSVMVTLKPDGWWPGGAPKYPGLNDAVKAAIQIDGPSWSGLETTVDRFGNMIVNSDPEMKAFSPEGRTLWNYPNRWTNVHGSHGAPLPSAGELQGILFFTGVAPLDDKSDVMVMNGNHGRAFVMTTDGLYVDEMFPDCRLMTNPQAGGVGILGGECFGGAFGLSKSDGNYYFQGGGIEYRIYRVEGLKETVRGGGSLSVTAEQVAAAERNRSRKVAADAKPCSTRIPYAKEPPRIDGKGDGWSGDPVAQWNKGNQFPVTIRAAYDAKNLYLFYNVKDASPWVNNGKDWQLLFKTGDSVDLQIGSDPNANPKRSGPVPGDLRLLIAPFQGGNIAVLYRHRQPGASDNVVFQSPWRNEKVDSVKKLESANIAVTKSGDSYNVEVAVPLADLGLANDAGKTLRGDFGIVYGDAEGTTNIFRNYWSNQATGLINDVPGEIMLSPNMWGDITMEVLP